MCSRDSRAAGLCPALCRALNRSTSCALQALSRAAIATASPMQQFSFQAKKRFPRPQQLNKQTIRFESQESSWIPSSIVSQTSNDSSPEQTAITWWCKLEWNCHPLLCNRNKSLCISSLLLQDLSSSQLFFLHRFSQSPLFTRKQRITQAEVNETSGIHKCVS